MTKEIKAEDHFFCRVCNYDGCRSLEIFSIHQQAVEQSQTDTFKDLPRVY